MKKHSNSFNRASIPNPKPVKKDSFQIKFGVLYGCENFFIISLSIGSIIKISIAANKTGLTGIPSAQQKTKTGMKNQAWRVRASFSLREIHARDNNLIPYQYLP